MNTKQYAQSLRNAINQDCYASLIHTLGNELNSRKNRFDKSDIIERAVETYSDERLEYVDEIGRDHRDRETGHDCEFKYHGGSLFTAKGNPTKRIVLKLKNSLGTHKGTDIEDPADFYIVGDRSALAVISWQDIKQYLVATSDGIEARMPRTAVEMIFEPQDCTIREVEGVSYLAEKAAAQRRVIESIL